jgi:CBS domain-containing protein
MTLEDVATPGVETAGPDTSVEVLADTMAERTVGSVVITEDGAPVGIVTDRDLALATLRGDADPATMTASDVMTPDPRTMNVNEGIFELTNAMCRDEVRRMPVVDADGHVVGIVTLDDLVRLLVAELGNLAGVIEAESPPY